MKRKISLIMTSVVMATTVMTTVIGCGTAPVKEQAKVKSIAEESIGLRRTSLYSEKRTVASKTEYTGMTPGTSERFERAYTNAPPMIPHSVEGLIPIEKNNNQCVGCHMPEIAAAVGATPIPKSHFSNWRPETGCLDNKFVTSADVLKNKTFLKKMKKALYKGRYNCTQCHAPQSQGNLAVENTFEPDFQNDGEKARSNLMDTLNDGVDLSE